MPYSHVAKSVTPLGNNQLPPSNSEAALADLFHLFWQLAETKRRDRFANTETVATRYSISQRTIQRWIKEGRIAALPVGRKYQVDLDSLKAHLLTLTDQHEAD